MKRLTLAATLTLISNPIYALEDIQNHFAQQAFTDFPCARVITLIDYDGFEPEGLIAMSMTFGVLLGFELANPGIKGDAETILTRLRNDCASNPDRTAYDLLQSYTQ